ncbi:tripartite motif-containing protein 3-like [Ptychodera flava]|uniref:tripartite motif-containing protein 3-like n=1 Tax=Ptychodera flava TaxID=63121 RepID=UPI00396A9CE4
MAIAASPKADKLLEEINEDFLSCSICLEQYRNPKVLVCNHTFCQLCLATLVEKMGKLVCPTCNAPCQLPRGGVTDLKGNFFIQSLIDKLRERETGNDPRLCEGCEDKVAWNRCLECGLNFCLTCTKPHRTTPITRNHKIVTLAEFDSTKSPKEGAPTKMSCSVHPEKVVKFYCDTCQVPACSDCIEVAHRMPGHKHRELQGAVDEYTQHLRDMVVQLRAKEAAAERCKSAARENREKVQRRHQEEEKKIRMKADEVRKSVTREEDRLVQGLKVMYGPYIQNTDACLDEWELKQGSISSLCTYLESLVQQGNASSLLSSKKKVNQRIGAVAGMEMKEPRPQKADFVSFYPSGGHEEQGMLGFLGSPVHIPKCTIDNFPTHIWTGDVANLTVRTRNKEGQQVTARVVQAQLRKPDGSFRDVIVTDNKDGTYSMRIRGRMRGRHQVAIAINKQPLPSSPFDIEVVAGLVKRVGTHGAGMGQFFNPTGIAINRHGDFVTADYGNGRIQITDSDGNYKTCFLFTQFINPFKSKDVAISADDEYFMTDYGNKQVVVSDENGQVLRFFRHQRMKYPRGIAISPVDGSVYVTDWDGEGFFTDTSTHLVWKFTKHGDCIKAFGRYGRNSGEFQGPDFLAVNSQGMPIVPDVNNERVQVFSAECQFLFCIGQPGSMPGALDAPEGVAVDRDDAIYVSEQCNRRVQKFDSSGRFISCIADATNGLHWPTGVAVTNDVPCKVAVVDRDNHCINIFAQ